MENHNINIGVNNTKRGILEFFKKYGDRKGLVYLNQCLDYWILLSYHHGGSDAINELIRFGRGLVNHITTNGVEKMFTGVNITPKEYQLCNYKVIT